MKRTKEVFIGTYYNGIMIENLPYSMKKDEVIEFACEMLMEATKKAKYEMLDLTYIANPMILSGWEADLANNKKAVMIERIDFMADYETKEVKAREIELPFEEYEVEEYDEEELEAEWQKEQEETARIMEECESEWQKEQEDYFAVMEKLDEEFNKLVEKVKEELTNEEMTFSQLDGEMMSFEFATVMNCISYIREDKNAVYRHRDGEVIVEFSIINDDLTNDEDTENFTLKIDNVSRF